VDKGVFAGELACFCRVAAVRHGRYTMLGGHSGGMIVPPLSKEHLSVMEFADAVDTAGGRPGAADEQRRVG
jgi:hypothetical protein